jgi:hypothetical protein
MGRDAACADECDCAKQEEVWTLRAKVSEYAAKVINFELAELDKDKIIASQRKQLETYAKVVLQDAEERTRLEILCEFYRDMFEDSIVEEKTELW